MSVDVLDAVERIDPEVLRDSARRLLADQVQRRAGIDQIGSDPGTGLYGEMANLGWLLLTAPVAREGLGQSFEALAPIYEEMGRALSPVAISAGMAAVDVLDDAAGLAASQLLDRILGGQARVVIAFAGRDPTCLSMVADAAHATDLLILPEDGKGSVALVDLRGAGVRIAPVETWDHSRSFADIHLGSAEATALDTDGAQAARIARAHLDLATAWDSIGGAQQALDEAIAYMGTRKQFGRPIGSFQALKHRAADLKVGLEVARALAGRATTAFAEKSEGWDDLAGQAHLLAVDSYRAITEESVQFHGGIGFTWEHDCHLFLKRALMNEVLGGTPEQIRDRVAPGILERALKR